MKRLLYVFATTLLSFGLLTACSSDKESNNGTNDSNNSNQEVENNEEQKTPKNNNDQNEEEDEKDNEKANGTGEVEGDTSAGDFSDQLDLKLGDTSQIESTLGKYEVTVEAIKEVAEIDGEGPELDHFFIADITIKNIGDTTIEAKDVVDNLRYDEEKEGTGFEDWSTHFESIEGIKGELKPGESISGKAVFVSYDNDTYYIYINAGLVASKAVKNQVIWTISEDEITS